MRSKSFPRKVRIISAIALPFAFAAATSLLSGWGLLTFGAVILILEVIALWPLIWHWRSEPGIFWLIALGAGGLIIILWLVAGIGPGSSVGITSFYEIASFATVVVIFLVESAVVALWIAQATDPGVRQSWGERLRAELGEPPGMYWMTILWGLLMLNILTNALNALLVIPWGFENIQLWGLLTNALSSTAFGSIRHLSLPIALVVTALHEITIHPKTVTRVRKAIIVGSAISLAVIIYLIASNLSLLLPNLFGVDVPETLGMLLPTEPAWQILTLAFVFALTVSRRHHLSIAWQVVITGTVAGALLAIILAYPVIAWVYSHCVPGFEYLGPAYGRTVAAGGCLAMLLALAIGPVAVLWGRPRDWQGQLVIGAAAGALAGAYVFGYLGGPAAGLVAQSPLYGVAFSRAGYSPGEWILKLAIAVNEVFPKTYGVFWLLFSGGAFVGALTGLLTPIRPTLTHKTSIRSAVWLPFFLVGILFLTFLVLVNIAAFAILPITIQRVFDNFGFIPRWRTEWILPAGVGSPGLVLIFLQMLSLFWLYREEEELSSSRTPAIIAFLIGLLGLSLPIWVWLMLRSELWLLSGSLVTATFGLETVIAGWQLWKRAEAERVCKPSPDRLAWAAAGAGGGVLAAVFSHQCIAVLLSLVSVSIAMIAELTSVTAPPPGLQWLSETLFPLFRVHSTAFTGQAVVYAVFGAVIGKTLSNWPWRWVLWICSLPQAIVHQAEAGIAALRRQRAVLGMVIVVAAGLLAAMVSLLLLSSFILATLTAVLTLVVTRKRSIKHLPWQALALAFSASWFGLVGLALQGPYRLPLDALWVRLIYMLLVGPGTGVACQALLAYTPARLHVATRLIAFLGMSLLVGILGYASWEEIRIIGGVSRYDGQRWEIFTSDNSMLGGRLNYQFFEDSDGHLWCGGGSGVIVERTAEKWRPYLIASIPDSSPREEVLGARAHFVEDRQGRMWVAVNKTFGQFDPGYITEEQFYLRIPTNSASEIELELKQPVSALILDNVGDLWVGTKGGGVLRLTGGRDVSDAYWEFFTTENSGLASNNVSAVLADRNGNIWFGTENGLSRFDGMNWEKISLPGADSGVPVTTLMEGSDGQLWVGTARGGYRWDGREWIAFDEMVGWQSGLGTEIFFEDSLGGLWAGTESGALRFNGRKWRVLVPDVHVTTFAEGPMGVIWIGSQKGLFRYDLRTGTQIVFNSENSGMAIDWVRDLHVDADGWLWVSTFAVEQSVHSPWWAIGLSVLFFGYLFANTYRGYERAPETRARRLGWEIAAEPSSLYQTVYALLTSEPDAPEVLTRLADHLTRANDKPGAKVVIALARLSSGTQVENALEHSIVALRDDSTHDWADLLYRLHCLLAAVLAARSVPEIADLELTVSPGHGPRSIFLSTRGESVEIVPPFLSQTIAKAWRALARVSRALYKYQEVDAPSDRLSYLADALGAIEAAQQAIQPIKSPEGAVMSKAAERWRTAITDEIDRISGKAELRLDLRTRQVRRAEQVTLALHLRNIGQAAAENIVVTLRASQGFSAIDENEITLGRLSAGRSAPVEFTIIPADVKAARIVCQVTWDDRVTTGNVMEFADVVRFYEVAEAFRPIPNPYIVGAPVKSAKMFYGREDVLQFIAKNLSGTVQDRTLVLYGQRRTGKTSILYQLLQGRLGKDFIPVLIDMQGLALLSNSTGDFLGELAHRLARNARRMGIAIEEPVLEAFVVSPVRSFNHFLDALEDILGDRRLLVMFDEFELIERKISEGKLDSDLLSYFRSLMQHRDYLAFIFTGTHRLEELTHDYWSIFFNIALHRRVSFLNPAEAARLIREPVAGALDIDDLAVEKIIRLTNGHPYFIQLICWALVNHSNAQRRNYATINDVNEVIQEILMTGEAHFAYIWQQASSMERLALAGLAHTLRPGKAWARPGDILDVLTTGGGSQVQREALIKALDRLVTREVLEVATEGALRYRFQMEILRLWARKTQSISALVEREQ